MFDWSAYKVAEDATDYAVKHNLICDKLTFCGVDISGGTIVDLDFSAYEIDALGTDYQANHNALCDRLSAVVRGTGGSGSLVSFTDYKLNFPDTDYDAVQSAFCDALDSNLNYGYIIKPGEASSIITYTQSGGLTYFDSAGVMQTAAVDTLTNDYNPATLARRGYGFWEARTNLAKSCNDFRSAANGNPTTFWGNTNISVNTTAWTAPNGTATGNAVTCNTNGAVLNASPMTITAGDSVTATVYAKYNNCDFLRVLITGTASECGAWFNLSTGATANNTAGSGNITFSAKRITSIGGGVYRVELAVTTAVITAVGFELYNCTSNGGSSVAGNIVNLWGAQVEVGLASTPLIFTTTAAVTRAAPQCSVAGSNFSGFYNAAGSTLVARASRSAAVSNSFVWCISDGTFNEFAGVYTDGTPNQIYRVNDGGVQQAALTLLAGAGVAGTAYKSAVSMAANSFYGAQDGVSATPDTSGTMPTVTTLYIGSLNNSSQYLNGWIDTLAYFNASIPASVGTLST